MIFKAARDEVYNRGSAPLEFFDEIVNWAKTAPINLFAPNDHFDIYDKIKPELRPFEDRTAVMLEVLRVLALFESSCNWTEGEDVSKHGANTNENAEAGAWQQSYDIRKSSSDIQTVLLNANITNGIQFQIAMKQDHELAMMITVMALRLDLSNYHHIVNGPIRKGAERRLSWPSRPKLWEDRESIYPYLSRESVQEFHQALTETPAFATIAK